MAVYTVQFTPSAAYQKGKQQKHKDKLDRIAQRPQRMGGISK